MSELARHGKLAFSLTIYTQQKSPDTPVKHRHSNQAELDTTELHSAGFILHAIFDLTDLPEGIRADLAGPMQQGDYTQLLVFAHAGKAFWRNMHRHPSPDSRSEHPLDEYSRTQIEAILQAQVPSMDYQFVYPCGPATTEDSAAGRLDLQTLGKLAGWHHDSPLRLGIHTEFGSWFAYRAVLLCNSDFSPTAAQTGAAPCDNCALKPCISHCPAGAVTDTGLDLDACTRYRSQPQSDCRTQCLARSACPVGAQHRYSPAQMNYHYAQSLLMIETFFHTMTNDQ